MKYKKMYGKLYDGSANWSIPKEFAAYVLSLEDEIKKCYRYTLAADEVFIHTICMNSNYRDKLHFAGNARFIDWENREGNSPKTFTMMADDELMKAISNSQLMFARKFLEDRDIAVVEFVERTVGKKGID